MIRKASYLAGSLVVAEPRWPAQAVAAIPSFFVLERSADGQHRQAPQRSLARPLPGTSRRPSAGPPLRPQGRRRTLPRRIQGQLIDGSYIDPTAGQTTLAEYAAAWQKSQLHRPTTVMQVDAHLRNHVMPFFGDRPIASIRPSELQAWVRSRAEVLAPATVEVVHRIFAAVLNTAVDNRLLARSPASASDSPARFRHEVQPPTVEEVEALIDAMPDRYKALAVLAAGTGLRQGECFGLTVDRVDFLRRTITVDRQRILPGTGQPQFGPPKTAASVRTVPLPKVVGESLAAHLERRAGRVWWPDLHQRAQRPASPQPLRRDLARCRSSAGLDGLRFHDLRHFYASLLIRHGESVMVVQARLGHASASETLDTYWHLSPDNQERTRAAVDEVLGSDHRYAQQSG